jgi:hypothetical protein
MNVKIKSFDVSMDVKEKGIELEVRTPNTAKGSTCNREDRRRGQCNRCGVIRIK